MASIRANNRTDKAYSNLYSCLSTHKTSFGTYALSRPNSFRNNFFTCEPFMDTELRRTHWQSQTSVGRNGVLQISFWERISLDRFFCFQESQRENEASLPWRTLLCGLQKWQILNLSCSRQRNAMMQFLFKMKRFLALEPSLSSALNDCSCLHNQDFLADKRIFRHGFQRPSRFRSFNYFICLVGQNRWPWYLPREWSDKKGQLFFRNAPWMCQ